jgi:hypothetical protein
MPAWQQRLPSRLFIFGRFFRLTVDARIANTPKIHLYEIYYVWDNQVSCPNVALTRIRIAGWRRQIEKSPRRRAFSFSVGKFWTKKCPHWAGINPFLGGDGGDMNHCPPKFVAVQHIF